MNNSAMIEQEIELAWLVKKLPDLLKYKKSRIVQAYIDSDDSTVKDIRIREKDGVYTKTIKRFAISETETGFCTEENQQLTEQEFRTLLKRTRKKVEKDRYNIPIKNKLVAELDVYRGRLKGLVVVEVEFPDVERALSFKKPSWFGKEVTDSQGIYPPAIAGMRFAEVEKINNQHIQAPHVL